MVKTGLVSITLRQLTPEEIAVMVRDAGLDAIEWGGDVHAPHGDNSRATHVREITTEAGLKVAAYGSYYRAGEEEKLPFTKVLDTAVNLGAPLIRIWAGNRGSHVADKKYFARIAEDSARVVDMAAGKNIKVAYEFHNNTLNDTLESSARLLEKVPGIKTYWQPLTGRSREERTGEIEGLMPRLENVHIFNWDQQGNRKPLSEGREEITAYINILKESGDTHFVMIEFVQNDLPENFARDAESLKAMI